MWKPGKWCIRRCLNKITYKIIGYRYYLKSGQTVAQATRKTTTRSPMAIHLVQGLKEAALWVFLAVAVLVFASLATFSPNDASPFYSGAGGKLHNAIGPVGAWLSAGLYFYSAILPSCFPSCWCGRAG